MKVVNVELYLLKVVSGPFSAQFLSEGSENGLNLNHTASMCKLLMWLSKKSYLAQCV